MGVEATNYVAGLNKTLMKLQQSSSDRKRAALWDSVDIGSFLQAFYRALVDTKIATWKDVTKNLGLHDESYSNKLRMVYLMCKKYPLILYADTCIRLLV